MSYIFYNPNTVSPYAGDCVVRAIAKYFGWDWQRAYLEICLHGAMLWDMPRDNRVWSNFLETRGLIRHHIPYFCTVKEFCDEHPIRCILSIDVGYTSATSGPIRGNHVVCAIDGNYYDAWDSGDEVPLDYWA